MADKRTQIFRQSKANNYSIIHNEVLRRDDLSWKAKGIMCYILSLPDDWEIYLEELIKHSTDKKASFRSGWNELIAKGYVRRYPMRNERGKISEWRTEIRENVGLELISPHTDFQEVENQEVDFQEVENQPLLSTYSTNDLSKQNTNNKPLKYSDEHLRLAEKLQSNLINDFPKEMAKVPTEKWADEIRLMEEKDKLTIKQIEFVIDWLPNNEFWFGNIRSASKLRKQFETLKHEIKKERANKQPYGRKPLRKETLPEWAENPQVEDDKQVDPAVEARLQAYLEKQERERLEREAEK